VTAEGSTVDATELDFAHARERLRAGGEPVREKHSGGASSLVAGADGDELVVHYPARGGRPATWRYPHDPALPQLARVPELLAGDAWHPSLPAALARAAVERRLMYNPARRAAFLLRPAGGGPVVLKLLSAAEAPASLRALRAVAASGLAERVPMPRLVAAAPAAGALLLDYLPGAPVTDWTPALLDAVAHVLAAVHDTVVDAVPAWSARRDVAKLDRLVGLLARADPGAAEAVRPAAAALTDRLSAPPLRTTTIHRDFTARHVLLVPRGRIGILDWDSVSTGPPEKDLATLAASLGATAPALLDRYERASGRALQRELVTALVQTQRLTRSVRRLLAGERPPAWAARAAGEVTAALAA